jgi:hypothetical protein
MKINIKKTTPLAPSCMLQENKAIINLDSIENTATPTGRKIKYIPKVVFTPVLSSARTDLPGIPSEPRLSKDIMNMLCLALSALFVNETSDKPKHEFKKDEAKNNENEQGTQTDEKQETQTDDKNLLGRYSTSIFSSKTNTKIQVSRSSRLTKA